MSKEEIDEYLNSIDEKDIRRNMITVGGNKNMIATKTKYDKNTSSTLDSCKSFNSPSALNMTNLILFLIVIVGLNILISVLK